MRPDRSPFYVKWAQAFVHFLPGRRLRDRSRQDVEAFLDDMGKRPGIEDWPVKQAEHVLKILYEAFLPGYASDAVTKPPQHETEEKKLSAGSAMKAGRFRDQAIPGEGERRSP